MSVQLIPPNEPYCCDFCRDIASLEHSLWCVYCAVAGRFASDAPSALRHRWSRGRLAWRACSRHARWVLWLAGIVVRILFVIMIDVKTELKKDGYRWRSYTSKTVKIRHLVRFVMYLVTTVPVLSCLCSCYQPLSHVRQPTLISDHQIPRQSRQQMSAREGLLTAGRNTLAVGCQLAQV